MVHLNILENVMKPNL